MAFPVEEELDPVHHPRLVFLSGPSFAREIADRRPTAVTLACREEAYAISVQATLSCPHNRCAFGPVYRGARFSIRKPAEICQDIRAMGRLARLLEEGHITSDEYNTLKKQIFQP